VPVGIALEQSVQALVYRGTEDVRVESVDDSALRIDDGVHLHITTRSAAWTASGSRLDIGM
jgi:hypothetical protein